MYSIKELETLEKLAKSLSLTGLNSLMHSAHDIEDNQLIEICEDELARRAAPRKRKGGYEFAA
jgi:uncharacterized protein with PIN domain